MKRQSIELAKTTLAPVPQQCEPSKAHTVLVIDKDSKALALAKQQLMTGSYSVITCSSCAEAASRLASAGSNSVDLILADTSCLTARAAGQEKVLAAGRTVPLVLTYGASASTSAASTIKQQFGAIDLIQKPLSMSKLRNLWRQSAMTKSTTGERLETSGCGTDSAGGESGSHASTSEQLKPDPLDFDLETTSFDAFNINSANELDCGLGLTAVMPADTPLENLLGADELQALFDACPENGLTESCSFGDLAREKPNKKGRPSFDIDFSAPWAQEFDRGTTSMGSVGGYSSATHSGAGASALPGSSQPAIGHPAGQLPPLPADAPGMVWGLPTNPLQIVPKPIPAMAGSTGSSPVTVPMPSMSPWGMMGSMMMGAPGMMPGMPGMPPMPPMPMGMFGPGMHGMMGALGMPSPPSLGAPAACGAPAKGKQVDSAQAPAPPCFPGFPPMPGMAPMMMPGFPAPCDMGPVCVGGVTLPAIPTFHDPTPVDLQMGPDGRGKGPQRPPLGLQLTKSPSFANRICEHLRQAPAAS